MLRVNWHSSGAQAVWPTIGCISGRRDGPTILEDHSGAERSLSQKKYIIDKTYTVWKVWAISFRNSWRKNPDLAAFWEKRKNVIFSLENQGFIRISLEFWLELLTIDYKLKLTFMFFSQNFGFFRLFWSTSGYQKPCFFWMERVKIHFLTMNKSWLVSTNR